MSLYNQIESGGGLLWLCCSYNVIVIYPNSIEIIVIVVMYGVNHQSACCILSATAQEQCWIFDGGYNLKWFHPNCTEIDEYWCLHVVPAVVHTIYEANTLPILC